ncbi:MAG: fumarate hydratase, partial [Nitrososphaerales archaeon]
MATSNSAYFYDSIEVLSNELYVRALKVIPVDVLQSLESASRLETNAIAKKILTGIVSNISKANQNDAIVCQDTGIPVYHLKVGDEMEINLAKLSAAVTRGCARATKDNNLRPNLVHPFTRINTGTN